MSAKVQIKGVPEMVRKLKTIMVKYPGLVEKAIYREAQIEMTESKKRCPVAPDGGTLRASGRVHPPIRIGTNISVLMSYGGAAETYAIAVHEHLSEHSPPSWVAVEERGDSINWNVVGTGPKFLESVVNESAPYMAARVGKRINLDKRLGVQDLDRETA